MSAKGYPVKVGNRWVSWYQYGIMLFDSGVDCPRHAHPHLRQGYVKRATEYVKLYGSDNHAA